MKKLIIILFFIPILASGQNWKIDLNRPDHQQHFMVGTFTSIVVTAETYHLIKDLNLKPWLSRLLASLFGAGVGVLAGHAKEIYDLKHGTAKIYNRGDFKATAYGAGTGSIGFNLLLWKSIPLSKVPEGEIIYDNRLSLPEVWDKRRIRYNKRAERKNKRINL